MSKIKNIYRSVNPFNNKLLFETATISQAEIDEKLAKAYSYWQKDRKSSLFKERCEKLSNVQDLLEKDIKKFAALMTSEMGKPIG